MSHGYSKKIGTTYVNIDSSTDDVNFVVAKYLMDNTYAVVDDDKYENFMEKYELFIVTKTTVDILVEGKTTPFCKT